MCRTAGTSRMRMPSYPLAYTGRQQALHPQTSEKEYRMVLIRRSLLLGLLAAAMAAPAAAQPYPARPIQMVVPFPPGGNTDLMARALQEELRKALGQPVIVINK